MKIFNLNAAMADMVDSWHNRHLWTALGWQDIKSRYRRSTLGPFWLTISMAVTVSAMGPLYGFLFSANAADFIPHIALGLIFWAFLSTCILEFGNECVASAHFMKQMHIPLTLLVLRVCYRNLVILGHNILIYPAVMLIFGLTLGSAFFWLVPALLLVALNVFWMGIILALFCTRFRDMIPVITSMMTLMFFVTPIVWTVDKLPPARHYLADLNPFTILLELLREPIMGAVPSAYYWCYAAVMATTGCVLALLLLARFRHRVTYWL